MSAVCTDGAVRATSFDEVDRRGGFGFLDCNGVIDGSFHVTVNLDGIVDGVKPCQVCSIFYLAVNQFLRSIQKHSLSEIISDISNNCLCCLISFDPSWICRFLVGTSHIVR